MDEESLRLSAALSLRLSASFFSLETPADQQGAGRLCVSVDLHIGPAVPVLVVVLGGTSLGSKQVLLCCRGGGGLTNVSLHTEMNALPGVEKGKGPLAGLLVLLCSRTLLRSFTPEEAELSSEEAGFTSEGAGLSLVVADTSVMVCDGVDVWLNVACVVPGEGWSEGSVPPGPVLTVLGLSRVGGAKAAALRPSWLSSEPWSVSSSDESTS